MALKMLRGIWQHVIRKKKIDPKDVNHPGDNQGSPNPDHKYNRKRKDEEHECEDKEKESEENGTQKKARVVWSLELHMKFVGAVNQLGIEKAVPRRILDLMNVEGLTRENVASHLQKYRIYLKRISSVATQQANVPSVIQLNSQPKNLNNTISSSLGKMHLVPPSSANQNASLFC